MRVERLYDRLCRRLILEFSCTRSASFSATKVQRVFSTQSPEVCIFKRVTRPRIALLRTSQGAQRRKSRSTVKVKDLPQGPITVIDVEKPENDGEPVYPTVVQQARNNMRKFDHCVVLTRVGSFYELYFEQAEELGPLLNLKLAKKKTNAGPVSMAGFPFFQLDRFLKVLVQDMNKSVAISEEFANDPADRVKSGGLMFDRKVTRIVTAGTLIDEKFIDPLESNYLLSIHCATSSPKDTQSGKDIIRSFRSTSDSVMAQPDIGLAWLDLSSGEFYVESTNLSSLSSIVARIGPREIVLDSDIDSEDSSFPLRNLKNEGYNMTYYKPGSRAYSIADWFSMLQTRIADEDASQFTPVEVQAGHLILHYITNQLQGLRIQLQPPKRRNADEEMSIDKNSLRALEVRVTMREGNFSGSLLHTIRKTVTKSGSRLLSRRLTSPSMTLPVINQRLDMVTEILENPSFHESLVVLLRQTFDTLRLVQKFSYGRGDADDLLGLSKTIKVMERIASTLHDFLEREFPSNDLSTGDNSSRRECIRDILNRVNFEGPSELSTAIVEAIDEEGLYEQHRIEESAAAQVAGLAEEVLSKESPGEHLPRIQKILKLRSAGDLGVDRDAENETRDVWIMRRGASPTLEKLHEDLGSLREEKRNLAIGLRDQLGAASLTLKWTPGLGHIVHVKGKDARTSISALKSARSVSSSKSTKSFHLEEWTHLGTRIDEMTFRIRAEEQRMINELRLQVVRNLVKLRQNAAVLDELDVACSFATLAREHRLVRPILNAGTTHKVIGGRHPTVEMGLAGQGRQFTSNNCEVGGKERILLITGPNMAGKSTFLRQNALISILAQVGSFVPADYAEIGLVDKIFSRVGSADNLYQDQSTFMVEMLETADILKQATSRSFVIMDEVGRGTTPEDGIAVGFACLHHLYHTNQCRALFATHFHALTDMTKEFENLACYCTDVAEAADGSFSFVHRVRKGVNRQSHALKVARLAGLPEETIAVAEGVLRKLHYLPKEKGVSTPLSAENIG